MVQAHVSGGTGRLVNKLGTKYNPRERERMSMLPELIATRCAPRGGSAPLLRATPVPVPGCPGRGVLPGIGAHHGKCTSPRQCVLRCSMRDEGADTLRALTTLLVPHTFLQPRPDAGHTVRRGADVLVACQGARRAVDSAGRGPCHTQQEGQQQATRVPARCKYTITAARGGGGLRIVKQGMGQEHTSPGVNHAQWLLQQLGCWVGTGGTPVGTCLRYGSTA